MSREREPKITPSQFPAFRNTSSSFTRSLLCIITLVLVGLLAYSNTFQVPFLLDDAIRIVSNEDIRTLYPPYRSMEKSNRPIVNFSFAINYAIHGLSVPGYHIANLTIHLLAGLLLFGVLRRSFAQLEPTLRTHTNFLAWWISALWIAHPIQTQAVTYINQRYESLMGFAFIATFYCSIRSLESTFSKAWMLGAFLACSMGMGCKEDMVTAPILLVWYDFAFAGRAAFRQRIPFYLACFSTWGVLAWSMLHYTQEYSGGAMINVDGLTSWNYLLSQSEIIVHYLRLSLFPNGLCFLYDWPIAVSLRDVIPSMLFVGVLFVLTVIAIFRAPKWSFLGGWFFMILAPTSSIIPLKDLAFEHRMYLPLAAVLTAILFAFHRWIAIPYRWSPRIVVPLGCVMIAVFAVGTWFRNSVYESEVSLWKDTIQKSPTNAQAWNNLGVAFVRIKDRSAARACFEKGCDLQPTSTSNRLNLASTMMEEGDHVGAESLLTQVIAADSMNITAIANLAHLKMEMGKHGESVELCERGLTLNPTNLDLRMSYSSALSLLKRHSEALLQCELVLKSRPDSSEAHVNLAYAHFRTGDVERALASAQRSIELSPNSAIGYEAAAQILQGTDHSTATKYMRRACELEPNSIDYSLRLANLLVMSSPEEAIPLFETVRAAHPDSLDVHMGLAAAYEKTGQRNKFIESLENVHRIAPQWTEINEFLKRLKQ